MSDPNHRADRFLQALQQDYVLVGKTRVHSWHAWVIIGACVGFFIALVIVANRSGELEPSRAAITGQVAAYAFDEGSGTTIEDSSGNNNTGTLTNGPTWTTGKIGGALSFDGVNDYVDLGNPLSLRPVNQITISAWINPTDVSTSKTIVSKDITGAADYFFRVQGPGGVRCNFEGLVLDLVGNYVLTNVWQHLACTYDGSIVSIYKDGILLSSSAASAVTYSDSGANIKIGRRDEGGGGLYFPGLIDDLRIYNRALTEAEIQTDMNTPAGGALPPDTTPPTISSISVSSLTQNSATISWTTNEPADTQVEYGLTTSYGSQTTLNTSQVTAHSQSLSGLSASTLYHYRVKSKDASKNLATSGDFTFTTTVLDTTAPSVPSNLTASVISSSQINLSWTASTDAVGVTGYRVERCLGSTCTTFTQIATPTGTTYNDTLLTAATTYRYRVRANDAAGNLSGYSSIVNGTTQSVTPPPSTKFQLNDRVQVVLGNLNVRATPSTSGTLLGSQPVGALGTIIGGPTAADGYNWWNVNYDTAPDGWSVEDNLAKVSSPTITIGETNILTSDDSGNGNLLLVQQATLSQTATLQSLSFYVTTASGKLRLGLYDATGPGGGPGQKKAEIAEFTPVAGWSTANVITPVSLTAGTYWLAHLPESSSLGFKLGSTGSFKYYSYIY